MKYSDRVAAVNARIKRLPRLYEDYIKSSRDRDADKYIGYWKSGILNNEYKLTPLKPETVVRKMKQGCARPTSPLYGLGLEGAHTFIKGMRKFRTSEGYVVRMTGKHHDSEIDNHALLLIHEYGLGNNPKRPAMHKSYARVLEDIKRDDRAMVKTINQYIRNGKWRNG
ncbi:MAG: hypothetical protein HDQ88_03620 [Clostridia bacterium]|nr:hypothetical protein [Clostridia bacterium]